MYEHTCAVVVLGAEVYPKMPQKKSKTVPEGNGPIPQDTSGLLGRTTMGELRRIMSEALDNALDKSFDGLKKTWIGCQKLLTEC